MQDWRRWPGEGKYARAERERRFLVVGDALPTSDLSVFIEDRYLDGTSLRLRKLTAQNETVWKLTQKVRPDPKDPAVVSITNFYLTADEYQLLSSLPAAVVSKKRTVLVFDDIRFVVDVLAGDLAGLQLAEVEVQDLEATLPRPAWLGREVTHDDRYSGGALARTQSSDLATLLGIVE